MEKKYNKLAFLVNLSRQRTRSKKKRDESKREN